MRVIAHHSKFFNWEPVPEGTEVTKADQDAGRVRIGARDGEWLMKVTREPKGGTHTLVCLNEETIVQQIIFEKCRPAGGRTLTRREAVATLLHEQFFAHNARDPKTHRVWITRFEVECDGGPDETLFRTVFADHMVAEAERVQKSGGAVTDDHAKDPNIHPDDFEAHLKAYLEPTTDKDHVAHLNSHFKVKAVA